MGSGGGVFYSPAGDLLDHFSGRKAAAKAASSVPAPPPPPPAAKPATLARASQATNAKAGNAFTGKARAGGTIGDSGPQGLQVPPQTSNLTLLGGTK